MASIHPSILASNWMQLQKEIIAIEKAGADRIHLDIMDGHFVPAISFGVDILKSIKDVTSLPVDVHLMVMNPRQWTEKLVRDSADSMTAHIELGMEFRTWLRETSAAGISCGVAIKPQTKISFLDNMIANVDRVLIMAVEPGFGGQTFLPQTPQRIAHLRALCSKVDIEVDGGITPETANLCRVAGANMLVAGTSIFKNSSYAKAIANLKGSDQK